MCAIAISFQIFYIIINTFDGPNLKSESILIFKMEMFYYS